MKINSNLENKIDDRSGVHNGKLTGERILLLKEAKKGFLYRYFIWSFLHNLDSRNTCKGL